MSHNPVNELRRVVELDGKSGKFELDESGNTRFIPSDEEQKLIEAWIYDELTQAIQDHEPLFNEARENVESYRAIKTRIDGAGGESILPSPLSRIPADQIIAYTVNTIMRARPVVSFDAYFPNEYEVPVVAPFQNADLGITQPTPVIIKVDAEKVAQRIEQAMEFKVRERLDFHTLIWSVITDCVTTGPIPAWVKVCREAKGRQVLKPKLFNGTLVDLAIKEESYARASEEVHMYSVSGFNVLMPLEEDDPNESPWLAERTPKTPSQVYGHCKDGSWFLVNGDEECNRLVGAVSEETTPQQKRDLEASTQNRQPQTRRPKCDVYEVWFYRDLKVIDPDSGKTVIKRYSLLGDFHYGAKKLASCFRNGYDHQKRIHTPFWQMKDPHSHSGSSTVGILKWHQKVDTHATQAIIRNGWMKNHPFPWYDPTGANAEWFQGRTEMMPSEWVPGKFGDDWGMQPFNSGVDGLMLLKQNVQGQAQETSNVSAYEAGQTIPGRTPSSTVSQILEQGRQQPLLFLGMLNKGMEKVFRLYLETVRQYQPMGETIPVRDPEKRAIIEVPFRLPVGEALDNFRIALTAADEALAQEHDEERLVMSMNVFQQHAQFVTTVITPMMSGQLSEPQTALLLKIVDNEQELFNRIISRLRTDEERFDLRPEVGAMAAEIAALAQQIELMEAANAANPAPGAAGVVPGPTGPGDGGGFGGPPQQPPMDEGAGPAPAPGLPPA